MVLTLGPEVQEPAASRGGGPVNEVDAVRRKCPPREHRLALEDVGVESEQ
jgi:hypothetical protein